MKKFWVVLVSLVVLTVAGYFGWKAWVQNDQQTNNNNNQQQQNDPSEGGKYLVIKEWGVRFLLPQSRQGEISYESADADFPTYILLSNKVNLDTCAPVSISRLVSGGQSHKKVGNYYYEFIEGMRACDTQDSQRQQEANRVQDELLKALDTLEEVSI